MNTEPTKAYVYQPMPPQPDGKFYGVGGLHLFGLTIDDAKFDGVDKTSAEEVARVCNENPDFAANFIRGLKAKLGQ